jgi:hypothetical protein
MAGSSFSQWTPVSAGVPQGAVISPLLYAVFVNDLDSTTATQLASAFYTEAGNLLYADDVAIAPPSDADLYQRHAALQQTLHHIGQWAAVWGVRFSSKKSGCVWFHQRSTPAFQHALRLPSLSIPLSPSHVTPIPIVNEYKYLGVWFDSLLSSDTHMKQTLPRVIAASNSIRSLIVPQFPPGPSTIRRLSLLCITSIASYALPFLRPKQYYLNRLDAAQRYPLRSCLLLPRSTDRKTFDLVTGLLPSSILRRKEVVTFISSELRKINNSSIRSKASSYPSFHLIWQQCNKESMTAMLNEFKSLSLSQQKKFFTSGWTIEREFFRSVVLANALHLLPSSSLLHVPPSSNKFQLWNSYAFKRAMDLSFTRFQYRQWIYTTRNFIIHTRGLDEGFPHPTRKSNHQPPYGSTSAPFLGVPSSYQSSADLHAAELTITQPGPLNPFLLNDEPKHACLRARHIFNRSSLNAVKEHRNKDPSIRRFCDQCVDFPPAVETPFHTITQCPRYQERRRELVQKLNVFLQFLHTKSNSKLLLRRLCPSFSDLFLHLVYLNPILMNILSSHYSQKDLIFIQRLTGDYLYFIHTIRPM